MQGAIIQTVEQGGAIVRSASNSMAWEPIGASPVFGANFTEKHLAQGVTANAVLTAIGVGVVYGIGAGPIGIGLALGAGVLATVNDAIVQLKWINGNGAPPQEVPESPLPHPTTPNSSSSAPHSSPPVSQPSYPQYEEFQGSTHVGVDTKLDAIPVPSKKVESSLPDEWETGWPEGDRHQVMEEQVLAKQVVIPKEVAVLPTPVVEAPTPSDPRRTQAKALAVKLLNNVNCVEFSVFNDELKASWKVAVLVKHYTMSEEQWILALTNIAAILPESYTFNQQDRVLIKKL